MDSINTYRLKSVNEPADETFENAILIMNHNDHRPANNSVLYPITPFRDNGEIEQEANSDDSDL